MDSWCHTWTTVVMITSSTKMKNMFILSTYLTSKEYSFSCTVWSLLVASLVSTIQVLGLCKKLIVAQFFLLLFFLFWKLFLTCVLKYKPPQHVQKM